MRIAKSILCKVKYPLCWLSLWGGLCERTFNTEHLRVTQFSWITVTKENKTVCTQISRHGERSSWASPSGGGGTGGSPGGSSPSELGTGSNVACKTASIAAWSPKRKPAWKTAASNDAFCQMLSNAHICIYVYILLSNIYVYIYIIYFEPRGSSGRACLQACPKNEYLQANRRRNATFSMPFHKRHSMHVKKRHSMEKNIFHRKSPTGILSFSPSV